MPRDRPKRGVHYFRLKRYPTSFSNS